MAAARDRVGRDARDRGQFLVGAALPPVLERLSLVGRQLHHALFEMFLELQAVDHGVGGERLSHELRAKLLLARTLAMNVARLGLGLEAREPVHPPLEQARTSILVLVELLEQLEKGLLNQVADLVILEVTGEESQQLISKPPAQLLTRLAIARSGGVDQVVEIHDVHDIAHAGSQTWPKGHPMRRRRRSCGDASDPYAHTAWGTFAWLADDEDPEQEGAPSPARRLRRLPPHWREMWKEILRAWAGHQFNPEAPLYKIGRFDAIGLRGQGGLGAVFEVIDPELDRHVALKLCLTRGPAAAEAITREAKVMAKLSHPNIITVHETGKLGDDVFFVMELVTGADGKPHTGRHLVHEQPQWRDAVEIYRAVARGLAAAHEAGVVHGDFKPANVLIDAKGRPRVADFGLSQVMIEHAPEGERAGLKHQIGTVPYMAPEVLRGQPGGPLADQWSFCVALWETVAGVRPYFGETVEELLEAIYTDEPYSPADPRFGRAVPKPLRTILREGLAVEASERYADMDALADELDELLKSPPDEPPETPPEQGPPPQGRPPGGILFFMTLGAFLVVLGAVGSQLLLRSQRLEQIRAPDPPADVDTTDSRSGGITPMSESSAEGDSGDTSNDAEEIAEALAEVLEMIAQDKLIEADKRWFDEAHELQSTRLLKRSALEISRAFLDRAKVLRKSGDTTRAKIAAQFATKWAVDAKMDPMEENTPAARTLDAAMELLAALRSTSRSR
jgi:serine/threonine protein kinase